MTLTTSRPLRSRRSSLSGIRSRAGFSILELTVVLVLVGIITAVATGRIGGMLAQQRVTRAAGLLQADMELAFTLAGRNRSPTRLTLTSTASELTFKVTDRSGTEYKRTDLTNSAYGLRYTDVTASTSMVEVYPNGFSSGPLTITISLTRDGTTYAKTVQMTRAGLVRVQ
jgi:prepilin-type N-terminal cleavage/methylation domain-containing protein